MIDMRMYTEINTILLYMLYLLLMFLTVKKINRMHQGIKYNKLLMVVCCLINVAMNVRWIQILLVMDISIEINIVVILFLQAISILRYTLVLSYLYIHNVKVSMKIWTCSITAAMLTILVMLLQASIRIDNNIDVTVLICAVLFAIVMEALFILYKKLAALIIDETRYKELEDEKAYFEIYANEIKKIDGKNRKLQHDLKNHLEVIGYYIKENPSKAISYLEDYMGEAIVIPSKQYTYTNNDYIDAMLRMKYHRAEENDIKIVSICSSDVAIKNSMELCSILGNVFDNAIEAVIKAETMRVIEFYMMININEITIKIINDITEPLSIVDGKLISNKADSERHGIGITSIADYCEKLDGNFEYKVINNQFVAEIHIPSKSFIIE